MKKDERTGYYINEVNGRRYAYRQKGHVWDKERKQARTSLEYMGTIDDDGNFIPKRSRMVRVEVKEDKEEPPKLLAQSRVGLTRVLWGISEDIGLSEALKEAFPKTWNLILSLSFFYASTGRNAAYLFPAWSEDHESPIGDLAVNDGDVSRLFAQMGQENRSMFLRAWRSISSSGKPCFHDITSISSYSRDNEMVEFGYNRDHEDLPQVNLGLIVDSGTRLPVYYSVHDGSIHDVATLRHVMKEGFAFNMERLIFVMDKGFYSRANISSMYSYRYGFIAAVPLSSGICKAAIDDVRGTIRHPGNIIVTDNGEAVYASVSPTEHFGDEGYRRACRIHVYASDNEDAGKRGIRLDMKIAECFDELNAGRFIESHAHLYAKYFEEHIEKDGENEARTYAYKDDVIEEAESRYAGYLVIITDQMDMTSKDILDIYRDKDAVEKAFFDLKNGQDARRLGTHSSATMKGKLFTLFISSILICEIRNRLSGLKENWTMDKVRQSLDKITFSTVRLSHSRKAKDLPGIVSAKQRLYLSKLLNCKPCEAEEKLFSFHIP